jgi:phosphatidylglycerol lysyltransferase
VKKTVQQSADYSNNGQTEYTQELNKKQQQLDIYLKRYGQCCVAYSGLQPDLDYYVKEGMGYIAYSSFRHLLFAWKGRKIVLANPVCADGDLLTLTQSFLREHKHVIFLQIDEKMAVVLNSLGYEINEFGIETELPMPHFSLAGKHRSKLRQWRNKCEKSAVLVIEKKCSSANKQEVEALSAQWIKRKGGHEYTFLTRPFYLVDEVDVRYFEAYQNEKLIGFAVFDPIYKDGKVMAYYHNVDRISADAPHGTGVYIILQAMALMEQEDKGITYISLGMSPLYKVHDKKFPHNKFTSDALWFTFHKLNFLYPFQGNASHKKKFHGRQKKVYLCSTEGNSIKELLATMKALKLF